MCKLRTRTRTPSQPSYSAMTFMAHVAQERLRLDSALRYLSPFSLCPHFFPFLSHSCSFRRTVRHPFSSKRLPCKRSSTEMQCKKCHTLFQRRPCTRHPQTLTIYCQQCRPFPVCTTSTFHCDLSLLPYYALRPTPPLYLIALPCHFFSSSHIRYLFLTSPLLHLSSSTLAPLFHYDKYMLRTSVVLITTCTLAEPIPRPHVQHSPMIHGQIFIILHLISLDGYQCTAPDLNMYDSSYCACL